MRVRPRTAQPKALRLRDFSVPEQLAFISSWSVPLPSDDRWPWRNWEQYLRDFEMIRPEFLRAFGGRDHLRALGHPLFAEKVRQIAHERGVGVLSYPFSRNEKLAYPTSWVETDWLFDPGRGQLYCVAFGGRQKEWRDSRG